MLLQELNIVTHVHTINQLHVRKLVAVVGLSVCHGDAQLKSCCQHSCRKGFS